MGETASGAAPGVGAAEVARMSYAEMVGLLDQVNMPPGGSRTIRQWARLARMGRSSYALDLACTTGFSSRALAALTGCWAVGVDICGRAVARAAARAAAAGLGDRLRYLTADAAALPFPVGTFTHVAAGGTFAFFQGGVLLTRVVATRPAGRPGACGAVVVDATTSMVTSAYSKRHRVRLVGRGGAAGDAGTAGARPYRVYGSLCMQSDVLGNSEPLAEPKPGDPLAVEAVGAYDIPLTATFIRPQPPVAMVAGSGDFHLIKARQTCEDAWRGQDA